MTTAQTPTVSSRPPAAPPAPSALAASAPPPGPNLSRILADLYDPDNHSLRLCDIHKLSVHELADALASEKLERAYRTIERITRIRITLMRAEAEATAWGRLMDIAGNFPVTPREKETARKAAAQILRELKRAAPFTDDDPNDNPPNDNPPPHDKPPHDKPQHDKPRPSGSGAPAKPPSSPPSSGPAPTPTPSTLHSHSGAPHSASPSPHNKKNRLPFGKAAVGTPLGVVLHGLRLNGNPVELLYRRSPFIQSQSITGSPPSAKGHPSRRARCSTGPPPESRPPSRRPGLIARPPPPCRTASAGRRVRARGSGGGSHPSARRSIPRSLHYLNTARHRNPDAPAPDLFCAGIPPILPRHPPNRRHALTRRTPRTRPPPPARPGTSGTPPCCTK